MCIIACPRFNAAMACLFQFGNTAMSSSSKPWCICLFWCAERPDRRYPLVSPQDSRQSFLRLLPDEWRVCACSKVRICDLQSSSSQTRNDLMHCMYHACVCVYTRIHACIRTNTHTHTHTHTHTRTHAHTGATMVRSWKLSLWPTWHTTMEMWVLSPSPFKTRFSLTIMHMACMLAYYLHANIHIQIQTHKHACMYDIHATVWSTNRQTGRWRVACQWTYSRPSHCMMITVWIT